MAGNNNQEMLKILKALGFLEGSGVKKIVLEFEVGKIVTAYIVKHVCAEVMQATIEALTDPDVPRIVQPAESVIVSDHAVVACLETEGASSGLVGWHTSCSASTDQVS